MKNIYIVIIIFISSFISQYFIMPLIMTHNYIYITNNLAKVYLSIIVAILVILFDAMIFDYRYNIFSLNIYAFIISGLVLFIYLYRNQIGVNDKQYLEEMIEQNSISLLTSEEILKKTDNYDVAKLAKNACQNQNDQIRQMRELISKM